MAWYHRLLNMTRRDRLARDIEREMAFHLAERVDDLMAEGMSEAEATREARLRFGNPTLQRERTYGQDVLLWLESVLADLRYAFRALRKSPGFAVVAIMSLGLGIGANTAIFSLLNALVMRTLPVENPQELLLLTFGSSENTRTYFTNPLWEELREQQDALSGAFSYSGRDFNLATGGEVRNVAGYWVSGEFLHVLGVRPVIGRTLLPSDDFTGCPAVAVVSHGFWQREYGGAPGAVGGTIMLDGHPFDLVGVVDPAFSGVDVGIASDVYTPLCTEPIVYPGSTDLDARSSWFIRIMGRPARGLTTAQAGARLATLAPRIFGVTVPQHWGAEAQQRYGEYTLGVRAVPNGVSSLRRQYREALLVLMGVVGVVLLIACGNVANLLLARATKRQHEVAIRRAIGSGRWRLVRQLVTESLLLSLLGAVVAVAFARWASVFLVRMLSASGGLWLDLSLDMRVLGFTLAIATATGVLFGLAPAWRATGIAPQAALRTAGRGVTDRHVRFATGKVLVVGQLALSLSLVVGAGLLIGTLTRLLTIDTGFDRNGVLLVSTDNRNVGYSPEESRVVGRELLERMRALPGVSSASAARLTPISNRAWNNYMFVDGYTPPEDRDALVWFNSTSDDYFHTLRTPLRAGRDFDARDVQGSAKVAVISETTAGRFFGEPQPLGRTFRTELGGEGETYEVVGVVADTKYEEVDEETLAIAYLPLSQSGVGTALQFQLRTEGDPRALAPMVTNVIEEMHPMISVRFTTLSDQVAASLTRPRILAVLSGFFGAVALLLAMIGLYGTLSYRVTSRRNEIGVRLALGAARTRVLRMVLGEVGRLVILGVALGSVVALGSTRLLATFLFEVTASDPVTLALSAIVLAVVALAAGALPAWRAARLDPMEALREE